jgi:hypothetical protein
MWVMPSNRVPEPAVAATQHQATAVTGGCDRSVRVRDLATARFTRTTQPSPEPDR